jgi:hypothetical protein
MIEYREDLRPPIRNWPNWALRLLALLLLPVYLLAPLVTDGTLRESLGAWLDGLRATYVWRDRCDGCGNEVDKDVCWCGELMRDHSAFDNHPQIEMGCTCHMHIDKEGK